MRNGLALVLATVLAGCGGGGGEHYPISTAEVKSQLTSVRPPQWIFGDGKGVEITSTQVGQDKIQWTIRGDDKAMLKYTATVAPDGDKGSVVTLDAGLADGVQPDQVTHSIATTASALKLYSAAMVEAIDARLDGRSFDNAAIQALVAQSMGTTFKQIDASKNEAIARFDEQARERKERLERERDAAAQRVVDGEEEGLPGGRSTEY